MTVNTEARERWTPGPWDIGASNTSIYVRSAGGKVCTMTIKPLSGRLVEGEFNATLVAAAPDLYSALRRLLDVLAEDSPHTHIIRDAYAALAKARGETP